jgi:hypothetical protein
MHLPQAAQRRVQVVAQLPPLIDRVGNDPPQLAEPPFSERVQSLLFNAVL